ncbi:MAG: HDOD domain-containing protein [Nitrococcus sp.]|nr:HDOD domain-containing protein [Nitrococcus sp.]
MNEHSDSAQADWSAAIERAVADGKIALPGLPEIAFRIRQAAASDSATADSLARLIAEDAALTARVMKVANAAAVRRSTPVSRLDQAIGRLGFRLVLSLVTGLCLLRQMERHSGPIGERIRTYHAHATEAAAIAHYLAGSTPSLDEHEALLAGLVHDIGALPILDFAARQPELAADETALETLLARHHAALGTRILGEWNFPERIVTAAAQHENTYRGHDGPADLVEVVIAANLQCGHGTQIEGVSVPALERFNLVTEPLAERAGVQASIDELRMSLAA